MDTATDWDSARYQCQCQGNYDLASITSDAENDFVNTLAGANEVWIGLNDKQTQETYVWSDGTAFDTSVFNKWDNNQPSNTNGQQDCVAMRTDGKWDDLKCNKDYKFVCETSTSTSTNPPVSTCTTPAPTTTPAPLTIPETEKCDSGWLHSGTKCLKFFAANATFDEARKSCKCDNAGELVSVPDEARNTLVKQLTGGKVKTWIGGTDAVTEGTFTWTDGTAWSFTKWMNANQPNNGGTDGNQDCVIIREDGTWDDVDCATQRSYVCEKDEKSTTSTSTSSASSTVAPPSTGACACAAGWTPSFVTNACYKRGEDSSGLTWQAAEARCQVWKCCSNIIIYHTRYRLTNPLILQV